MFRVWGDVSMFVGVCRVSCRIDVVGGWGVSLGVFNILNFVFICLFGWMIWVEGFVGGFCYDLFVVCY